MPFLTYPDAGEIEVLMKSASYWPQDANKQKFARRQAQIAAAAAADGWENLVGWGPFLSTGVSETRYFEGGDHNGDLDFKGGLLTLESVAFGGTDSSTNCAPHLWPSNSPAKKRPYTHLRGMGQMGGNFGSLGMGIGLLNRLAITGVWGFSLEVPGDVYQGLLQLGARIVMQQIENLQSIGSISQDGFSKSFDLVGILTQKDLSTLWGKDFNSLVQQYSRPIF